MSAFRDLVRPLARALRRLYSRLIGNPAAAFVGNTGDMKQDWNDRARHHARYYINCGCWKSEEEFLRSGVQDLESLILPGIALGREHTALEIGCGLGRLVEPLADRAGTVYGVDVSGEMIRQAQERLAARANIRLFENSGSDLSMLADGSVDFCFSYIVFQHIPRRDLILAYLDEAARVLKPRGILRLQVDGRHEDHARREQAGTWAGVVFSGPGITAILEERGFEVRKLSGDGTYKLWVTAVRREKGGAPASTVQLVD